jgi:hypothetical protein
MGKLSIAIYSISLLMIFSPAFLYMLLRRAGLFYPSIETQVVSVLPFIAGIAILAVMKLKKTGSINEA